MSLFGIRGGSDKRVGELCREDLVRKGMGVVSVEVDVGECLKRKVIWGYES